MHSLGRFVFQRQVGPFRVVDLHCLFHHFSGLVQIFWATQEQLGFENPVDSLS
jgi:hypothetical protein